MRTSFAVVLAMAIGISAAPQATYSLLPISQISDGQIQAPPATATGAPSVPVVTPTGSVVVPPVVSSVVEVSSGAPVVPTAPITGPAVTPTVPVVIPTAPVGGNATVPVVSSVASFLNSTIAHTPTSAPGPTSAGAGASASPSGSAPAQPGAANSNMVSFGSLAMAAIAGAILA